MINFRNLEFDPEGTANLQAEQRLHDAIRDTQDYAMSVPVDGQEKSIKQKLAEQFEFIDINDCYVTLWRDKGLDPDVGGTKVDNIWLDIKRQSDGQTILGLLGAQISDEYVTPEEVISYADARLLSALVDDVDWLRQIGALTQMPDSLDRIKAERLESDNFVRGEGDKA